MQKEARLEEGGGGHWVGGPVIGSGDAASNFDLGEKFLGFALAVKRQANRKVLNV